MQYRVAFVIVVAKLIGFDYELECTVIFLSSSSHGLDYCSICFDNDEDCCDNSQICNFRRVYYATISRIAGPNNRSCKRYSARYQVKIRGLEFHRSRIFPQRKFSRIPQMVNWQRKLSTNNYGSIKKSTELRSRVCPRWDVTTDRRKRGTLIIITPKYCIITEIAVHLNFNRKLNRF